MDLGVRDQGYLIVGGTAGMGFEAARSLAADGARVAVCGRDEERAQRAADAIAAEHAVQAVPIVGDVSKGAEEAERVVAEATAALGDLAGMAVTTGLRGHHTLEDATDEVWEDAVQDVLMSIVRTVKAVLPQLVARGSGTIVTTSAYSIHAPHANRMPYVALKGAVAVFTKNVAKSYGRAGVRANCVCPGRDRDRGPGGAAHAARDRAWRPRRKACSSRSWSTNGTWTSRSGGPDAPKKSGSCSRSCSRPAPATSPAPRSTSTAAPTSETYPFAA